MWSVKVVGTWSVTWSVCSRYGVVKESDVVGKNLEVVGMWSVTFFISDNDYLKR